ncbi:TBC1 domain family member 5-like isoform X4 [Haliotis rufescens]|uniref:TBC1 domain family member 5-like isoform X4 n=1 Tax=Haliotis rufescens TaxID=6454 RepID=UPI00201E76AE|nr:TBC1 domain family member 5-like isoform X4 [Haliotis rufescens]
MESVLGRLRTGSKSKKTLSQAPSKDDILNAIDTFDKNGSGSEDNNNLVRKSSVESGDGRFEGPDELDSPSVSYSHSYRGIEPPVQTDWMWTVIREGSKYSAEWERLFNTPGYLLKLKKHGIEGRLRSSRFRSVVWKVYLEVLPDDISQWLKVCQDWRNKYEVLKNQLIVNPRKAVDRVDITINNPLSQDDESPWNQFFQDNELRLTIKQDVIRTFPELEFFKSEELRDMMINVLFCYCRTNREIGYRQGMHELLAPLIFVLHCDHQAFLHASEIETLHYLHINHRDIVKEIMSPTHLEHDAYAMFCQIMETVEPWYTTKEHMIKGREYMVAQPFSRPQDLNPSNVIVTKLTRIQDYLLKKFDAELHLHLERLDIAPQIYGIRWVRLLFGREFPMQDLLVIWDAIFADGIGFDLVDYVFVSMLLYIRDLLLASDYAASLSCLMKYVPVGDVHYFIEKALYLREPNQYPRPPNYTYQNVNTTAARSRSRSNQTNKRHGHGYGGFSSFSRKFNRPRTLAFSSKNLPKSSSEPMNLQTDISPALHGRPTPQGRLGRLSLSLLDIYPVWCCGSSYFTASPVVPDVKRGSSASLSQLEDQMFRHTPSSSSLARLEVINRSTQSTPAARSPVGFSADEGSTHSSPTKYSSLPGRSKAKGKKFSRAEQEMQLQVSKLQGQMNDKSAMCRYCSTKLDIHIERLQSELMKLELDADDEVMLALAGVKQVRDVLNGTLRFSQNLLDEDEISISDNYYKDELVTSPESDIAGSMTSSMTGSFHQHGAGKHSGKGKRQKLFYMSSEENSEAADSPDSFNGVSHPQGKDYELDNFLRKRVASKDSYTSGGPQLMVESTVSDSGSQSSNTVQTHSSASDAFDVSPNPLYDMEAQ